MSRWPVEFADSDGALLATFIFAESQPVPRRGDVVVLGQRSWAVGTVRWVYLEDGETVIRIELV